MDFKWTSIKKGHFSSVKIYNKTEQLGRFTCGNSIKTSILKGTADQNLKWTFIKKETVS